MHEAPEFGLALSEAKQRSYLAVEIGCGVGWHALQYAHKHPEHTLIAIERTSSKFERFENRYQSHKSASPDALLNLTGIHADATLFLDQTLENQSVNEVFLLYPNPEPKAPNQRWLRSVFMQRLLELMKPGARLHLATNIQSYSDESLEYAKRLGLAVSEHQELTKISAPDFQPRTHFEKKYYLRGETLFLTTWTLSQPETAT